MQNIESASKHAVKTYWSMEYLENSNILQQNTLIIAKHARKLRHCRIANFGKEFGKTCKTSKVQASTQLMHNDALNSCEISKHHSKIDLLSKWAKPTSFCDLPFSNSLQLMTIKRPSS